MKALLIVTLVSGLSVEPAVMQDMKTCLAQVDPLTKQAAIKDAACVPYVAKPSMEEKFQSMMVMFLELLDTINAKQYTDNIIKSEKLKHENARKCGPKDWLTESPTCDRVLDDTSHLVR